MHRKAVLSLLLISATIASWGAKPQAAVSAGTPTPTRTASPTTAPSPTTTPTTLPSATPIPPFPVFQSGELRPEVAPQAYVADTCAYLARRWDPNNAEPGTVVAPFFFHSVANSGSSVPPGDNTTISQTDFKAFMEYAHRIGFQTITANDLANFLEFNAKIPPRSMILIVDDRRPGVIREHFLPYLQQFHWTVTLGYIAGATEQWEWNELDRLNADGQLDVQAHGFLHNGSTYITDKTPETTILKELYAPIPLLRWHFGSDPVAFIWPGGDFNARAVQIAQLAHYRIGFTVFSRGPVMYNWIPQGPEERAVGSPLMVLPRYWSTAASPGLDQAARIGDQARTIAADNKEKELEWMQKNCR